MFSMGNILLLYWRLCDVRKRLYTVLINKRCNDVINTLVI